MESVTEIGIISALVVILGKVFDILQKLISSKFGSNKCEGANNEVHKKLDTIMENVRTSADIQSKVDNDGIPMVYFPRHALEQQHQSNQSLLNIVRNVEQNQIVMSKSLEKTGEVIENTAKILLLMEDRMNRK